MSTTQTQVRGNIDTNIRDNQVKFITPSRLRGVIIPLVDWISQNVDFNGTSANFILPVRWAAAQHGILQDGASNHPMITSDASYALILQGDLNTVIGWNSINASSTTHSVTIGNQKTRTSIVGFYNAAGTEVGRLYNSGNIVWGATTDNGNKLQVTGDGNITGKWGVGILPVSGYDLSVFNRLAIKNNGTAGAHIDLFTRTDFTGAAVWTWDVSGWDLTLTGLSNSATHTVQFGSGAVVYKMTSGTTGPTISFGNSSQTSNTRWMTPGGGGAGVRMMYLGPGLGTWSTDFSAGENSIVFTRQFAGGGFDNNMDTLMAFENGCPEQTAGNLRREVAHFVRSGYLGIGTNRAYGAGLPIRGAVSINVQQLTGWQGGAQASQSLLSTSGTSATINFSGGGNGSGDMMMHVGAKITANSLVRYVQSQTNGKQFVIDTATDFSAGYTYVYQNPYFSIYNNTTPIFNIDADANVNIGHAMYTQPSALLSMTSTTKGLKPPSGTNAQMLAISSPVESLIFYDLTNHKLCCWDGTTWQALW